MFVVQKLAFVGTKVYNKTPDEILSPIMGNDRLQTLISVQYVGTAVVVLILPSDPCRKPYLGLNRGGYCPDVAKNAGPLPNS